MSFEHYDILAEVFYFPDNGYAAKTRACEIILEDKYPELVPLFRPFREFVESLPVDELEKIFIRTFDIQALCCLDVGYVLFGEDYTRGKILANLNREHNRVGIDCRGELADRLPNVLRLIPRLDDTEMIEELVSYLIKPALGKMINEFQPLRIREKEEIYLKFHKTVLESKAAQVLKFQIPLIATLKILEADFPELEAIDATGKNDYMDAVKGEMINSLKENKF